MDPQRLSKVRGELEKDGLSNPPKWYVSLIARLEAFSDFADQACRDSEFSLCHPIAATKKIMDWARDKRALGKKEN